MQNKLYYLICTQQFKFAHHTDTNQFATLQKKLSLMQI